MPYLVFSRASFEKAGFLVDVFRSAFSLVIYREGNVTIDDIDRVLERYRIKRGVDVDRDAYIRAVKDSRSYYLSERQRLMICTDGACLKRCVVDLTHDYIEGLAKQVGCSVITTGCHWRCDDASVVSLKVGAKSSSYLNCDTEENYIEMLESVKKLIAEDGDKLVKRSRKREKKGA